MYVSSFLCFISFAPHHLFSLTSVKHLCPSRHFSLKRRNVAQLLRTLKHFSLTRLVGTEFYVLTPRNSEKAGLAGQNFCILVISKDIRAQF
jgi:hypothetical protein